MFNNKELLLSEHIYDCNLDFLCLTETWHQQNDCLLLNQVAIPGFGFIEKSCSSGRGGSLAVVYNLELNLCLFSAPAFQSFEFLVFKMSSAQTLVMILIYRPPKHNNLFLPEFADLLSVLCLKFSRILIMGDFNIHIDSPKLPLVSEFLALLDCFGLSVSQ